MAYNKVEANGETLIDLTSDTVTADTLVSGRTAHLASGERVTGTFEPVTGVKGNAETEYRTGNVNLTPANLGLGNVNNTSDANKPISTATQAALDAQQAQVDDNSEISETSDTTPYIYKSSEHDALYDELVGGSVAWNQLVQNGNFESTSGWATSGGTMTTLSTANNILTISSTAPITTSDVRLQQTINFVDSHKYLFTVTGYSSATHNHQRDGGIEIYPMNINVITIVFSTTKQTYYKVFKTDTRSTVVSQIRLYSMDSITSHISNLFCIDLTQMFGTTIADYVYNLEQSTAGSGVEWLKSYGFFTKDYYAYNAGGLISVNTSGKKVVSETTEITYPIQSTDLRGLYKLNGNKLYIDGDIYSADGQITRKYGYRDYQSGDESRANAITDGTHTIYKLSAPTTENAQPFASPQMVYRNGTEEYLDTRDVPIPIGGNRKYVDIPDWMVNEYFDDLRAETSTLLVKIENINNGINEIESDMRGVTQDLDDISEELDCLTIQAALVNNEVIIQNTSDFTDDLYRKYASHTKPKFAILELHITSSTHYYKALINTSSVSQATVMEASFITVNGTYMSIYKFNWSLSGTVGTPTVSHTSLNLGS